MEAIVETIFNVLTIIVEGFFGVLGTLFNSVISIFWTAGTEGTGGSLTFLGIVLIIGAGTPLVFWGLRWVVNLFKGMIASRGK